FPGPVKAGLNLDEIGILDLFAIFEIQFAGEDLIGFIRVIERHTEFVAHERAKLIDGANVIDQSRTSKPRSRGRKVAPGFRLPLLGDQLAARLSVLAGSRSERFPLPRLELLNAFRDVRRFDFRDLELLIATIRTARAARRFFAVKYEVSLKLPI